MTVTFPGILWDALLPDEGPNFSALLHQRDESCWLVGNGGLG